MLYMHIYHTYLKCMQVFKPTYHWQTKQPVSHQTWSLSETIQLKVSRPTKGQSFLVLICVTSGNQKWLPGKWTVYQWFPIKISIHRGFSIAMFDYQKGILWVLWVQHLFPYQNGSIPQFWTKTYQLYSCSETIRRCPGWIIGVLTPSILKLYLP